MTKFDLRVAGIRLDSMLGAIPRPVPLPRAGTQDIFTGTAGNDRRTGTAGDDFFNMSQGGLDRVRGVDGDDTIMMGATLDSSDVINGGRDRGEGFDADRVTLLGDYSGGVVFNATTMTNVGTLTIGVAYSYNLTLHDATISAGSFLTINFEDIGGGIRADIIIDASAETDGFLQYLNWGGLGWDTVTGGAGNDFFIFNFGGFNIEDRIDGGSGDFDSLDVLAEDVSGLVLDADTFRNIDRLFINGGMDEAVVLNNGNVAAGQTLLVLFLAFGGPLLFDGSNERDGRFIVDANSNNNDVLIGGAGDDELRGRMGDDVLRGGKGADICEYRSGDDGDGVGVDRIIRCDFDAQDRFRLLAPVTGVDTAIATGELNSDAFIGDVKRAIGAEELAAQHVVLFTPDSGDLAGHIYLVIDCNGSAGYQPSTTAVGRDLVVELVSPQHLELLDTADFITLF